MKSKYNIDDNVGLRYGSWTILSFAYKTDREYWNCRCKCGLEKPVRADHLVSGNNNSCRNCSNQKQASNSSIHWKGGNFISKSLLLKYFHSAKKRKLSFELNIRDLEELYHKQKGLCIYTNEKLTFPTTENDYDFTASIDRIDSDIGYIKDNIQWVTKKVNIMKMSLSHNEFIELCKLISNNYSGNKKAIISIC